MLPQASSHPPLSMKALLTSSMLAYKESLRAAKAAASARRTPSGTWVSSNGRTLKRGDTRPDGMVFWSYKKQSSLGEVWMTGEQFSREILRTRSRVNSRLATDPLYALRSRLRSRTRAAFVRLSSAKPARTENLLNCSWEYAKAWIERQFPSGMTWENRDLWHIDHRIPLASGYDSYTTALLCDIHNLCPMWGPENLSKGKTFSPPDYCI